MSPKVKIILRRLSLLWRRFTSLGIKQHVSHAIPISYLAAPPVRVPFLGQVLKEPDKPPEGNKYFWVTASGPPNKPIYLFHYDPSRGSAVADALLGFRGTVISDDWPVYARVCEKHQLTHIACNDHARRKFDEALKAEPKNKSGKGLYGA